MKKSYERTVTDNTVRLHLLRCNTGTSNANLSVPNPPFSGLQNLLCSSYQHIVADNVIVFLLLQQYTTLQISTSTPLDSNTKYYCFFFYFFFFCLTVVVKIHSFFYPIHCHKGSSSSSPCQHHFVAIGFSSPIPRQLPSHIHTTTPRKTHSQQHTQKTSIPSPPLSPLDLTAASLARQLASGLTPYSWYIPATNDEQMRVVCSS